MILDRKAASSASLGQTSTKDLLAWLSTDMCDSVIYKNGTPRPSAVQRCDPHKNQETADGHGSNVAALARRAPTARGKRSQQQQHKGSATCEEELSILSADGESNKSWLEDMVSAVNHELRQSEVPLDVARTIKTFVYGLGLEFCWCGSLKWNAMAYAKWSSLRRELQKITKNAITHRTRPGGADEQGDLVDDVVDLLTSTKDAVEAADSMAPEADLIEQHIKDLATEPGALKNIAEFMQSHPTGTPPPTPTSSIQRTRSCCSTLSRA